MKLSDLKIDSARAEQGAWVGDIPDMPGLRLRVRGFGNTDDKRVQAEAVEALPRAQRIRGRLDAAAQDAVMTRRLLDAILTGWDGLEGDDGQPLAYSRETAEQLLANPDYAPFRGAVIWAASIVAEDKAAELKDAVGK